MLSCTTAYARRLSGTQAGATLSVSAPVWHAGSYVLVFVLVHVLVYVLVYVLVFGVSVCASVPMC